MHENPPDEPADDDGPGRHRRPSLWILLAALVGVSAVVLVVALAAPFEPGAGDAEPVAAGDAIRGASLFEGSCAGCHGPEGSGGGIGPQLAGRELAPEAVAGVIASGRGAMPAGLVEGSDRDDVVAYVVSLGSGELVAPATEEAEAATETEAEASSEEEPASSAEEPVAAAGEGDATNGQALFDNTCAGCHGIGAEGGSGPALAGSGLTEEQVRAKVESGGPIMPASLVEGSDLDDIVAYVGTLTGAGGQAAVEETEPETVAAEEPPAEPVGDPAAGEAVFEATCAGCHGVQGTGGQVGPELAGAELDEEGVRTKIQNGGDVMPAGLAEGTDLDNVVAYVLSISAGGLEVPPETAPETETTAPAEPGAPPTGTVALTGAGLVGLQVNLEAPAEVAGSVFLVGPAKKKEIGSIAVGDSELEVVNADVGTILDGYDTVIFGPAADRPISAAPIGGAVDAMRQLAVSSEVAPDGASLVAAAQGQVKVLRDHIRFLKQSLAEGNLVNVRFHGEHLVNIVRGEPIVNLDGLGGADNPGDGVGLVGKDGRDGYLPLIAATTAEIAAADGADEVAAASAETVGTNADVAQGLLEAVAGNANTCAKAPSLQRARVCVRTIDRLEEQVVQTYRQMNRFAARVPVFSLDPFEAG